MGWHGVTGISVADVPDFFFFSFPLIKDVIRKILMFGELAGTTYLKKGYKARC